MRVHRNRHTTSFVVVPNAAARHRGLSLTARGLLVTLLSLPDGTRATIDTITDQVEEGRRAVAKAFTALESAGYLRRERGQDPETGLWGTQSHISDLPMDRIPAAGEPSARSVGDSPKGIKNQGKNLLPVPAPQQADEADVEEEEEASDTTNDHAPADAEAGQAAAALAHLGGIEPRLKLSTTEVLRLAPLAAAWLAEGHNAAKITAALMARLPENVDSAAALISYRLKNQMPERPAPKSKPLPDTRDRCEVCRAPFPLGRHGEVCATCKAELDRAAALLAGTAPAEPEPTLDDLATARQGRERCRAAMAA
ncbi:helix-turn-helix domain-containing protein [Streptomyces sp. AP-93]|uniref:helix-turn-helix domain-containing protein n=1 Tax=Streptomyces sp. AP-93 TaxID=2929048 RepID=UPI001FAE9DFD|nr:helix-turn-helix domain-containing protein [Streptomyces sp. AP-93]MCJ0870269.1 helix-turn-helix domain-containing protein [Streptomyces sp. AP-93]